MGIALFAMLAMSCSPTTYGGSQPGSSQTYDDTDFNGRWQIVDNRSDNGQDWYNERAQFNDSDWGSTGSSDRMRYGAGAWFLPDEFRIDGSRRLMRIVDENGGLIAEVDMNNGDTGYGSYDDRNDRRGEYSGDVHAYWVNDRRFEVERIGRNDRRIVQSFTIGDRGRQLVVGTRVERDGGTRTYTRVYDRV